MAMFTKLSVRGLLPAAMREIDHLIPLGLDPPFQGVSRM